MISAKEARDITEKQKQSDVKINKLIEYTDKLIQKRCDEGFNSVSIDKCYINKLSKNEQKEYISILNSFGYTVNSIFSRSSNHFYDGITNSSVEKVLNFYEITW